MSRDVERLIEELVTAFREKFGLEVKQTEFANWPEDSFIVLWIEPPVNDSHDLWSLDRSEELEEAGHGDVTVVVRSTTELEEDEPTPRDEPVPA